VALVALLFWLTFAGGRFNFWVLKFGWVLLVLAWRGSAPSAGSATT
jgi:hypothetical protein